MCMTCGCGLPHEGHGDSRHIIYEQLKEAAEAAGISPEEAADKRQGDDRPGAGGWHPSERAVGVRARVAFHR
jgi:hypothetical protein